MREMLKPTSAIMGLGLGDKVAFITDGRFSGGTHGFVVGHISPEAADGGLIALIEDGDSILIDSNTDQLTLKVNEILENFFKNIQLQLVDFKLEYGYDLKNNILLGDEISPDNCRLWDLNQENDTIVSLDKDRFRNDLGGLIEAYSEIHRRINNFL